MDIEQNIIETAYVIFLWRCYV